MEDIVQRPIVILQFQDGKLILFIVNNQVKKRVFDHKLALKREVDLGIKAVLAMAGKKPNEKGDGSVCFCIGDCMMGTTSAVGSYAGFQNALVKKVRELGYFVVFRSEHNTSQKFPILGHQTSYSGSNGIRIKFCWEQGGYEVFFSREAK